MGKSWPLQRAQPFGGQLKLTIFISLRNGSDISLSLADGLRERCKRLDEASVARRGRRAPERCLEREEQTWVRPRVLSGETLWNVCLRVCVPCALPLSDAARILNLVDRVWQEQERRVLSKKIVSSAPPDIHCPAAGKKGLTPP